MLSVRASVRSIHIGLQVARVVMCGCHGDAAAAAAAIDVIEALPRIHARNSCLVFIGCRRTFMNCLLLNTFLTIPHIHSIPPPRRGCVLTSVCMFVC